MLCFLTILNRIIFFLTTEKARKTSAPVTLSGQVHTWSQTGNRSAFVYPQAYFRYDGMNAIYKS